MIDAKNEPTDLANLASKYYIMIKSIYYVK